MTAIQESSPAPGGLGAGTEATPIHTILVVEDTEALRRMTSEFLKFQGYEVLGAADGATALQVARGHSGAIDLLLTDVCMPKMGGVELARELRAERPELRVLYTSGYDEQALKAEGVTEADAFLPKPYTPSVLLGALRSLSI